MRGVIHVLALLLALATGTVSDAAERRVALVVGNGAYVHTTPLSNPLNDARDMTEALKAAGFEVIEALDAAKSGFDSALRGFTDRLAGADVALFYYAGHGLQVGSQNYLVPTDARLERERDLDFEAVKLEFVLRQMEIDRDGKTSIVVLDACRDNPLARNLARSMGTRSASVGRGLAAAATGLGTFIAYSTQPGNVALDGKGRNSPFTAALAKHVRVRGLNLNATMIEVRKDVVAATGGKQVPWDHSALTGDFYFLAADRAPSPGSVEPPPPASAEDVVALKERLARLEAEARERERSSGQAGAAPGAMIAADGIKLAELRARAASLEDMTKDLQRRLMASRMEEGKALDPNEKSKLQKKSIDIQMEWTRRGLDLKKLKEEIAALEGKSTAAAPVVAITSPIVPQTKPRKTSPNFQESDKVALAGTVTRIIRASSPVACRDACEKDEICMAFQHGRKSAVMGQCILFSAHFGGLESTRWRSGTRITPDGANVADGAEAAVSAVRAEVPPPNFSVHEQSFATADVEKATREDTLGGCAVVCRNTPGCEAATFVAPKADGGSNCLVHTGLQMVSRSPVASSIVLVPSRE